MNSPIILITGAGRPAGQNLAEALAGRGAIIAAVDINPLGLDACLERVKSAGGKGKDYAFDATKRLPVVALVQSVLDDWGRIDVLINASEADPQATLFTLDEWDFHRALDVNLAGPFLLMQRVGQVMKEQGRGLIINVGAGPDAGALAYRVGKAALAALTEAVVQELAGSGIQVLWVEAGDELTEKVTQAVASGDLARSVRSD
jgi:NAD(P)-dependent dehydrogenase (short-subunit alcohol dehydrogenase family)